MSRFIGENTVFYLERKHAKTNEEKLMRYDEYEKIWRTADEFRNATESQDLKYLQGVADMNNQMEAFKVQLGMQSEAEFNYHVIKKEELTYHVDENEEKIIIEDTPPEEPEPIETQNQPDEVAELPPSAGQNPDDATAGDNITESGD